MTYNFSFLITIQMYTYFFTSQKLKSKQKLVLIFYNNQICNLYHKRKTPLI